MGWLGTKLVRPTAHALGLAWSSADDAVVWFSFPLNKMNVANWSLPAQSQESGSNTTIPCPLHPPKDILAFTCVVAAIAAPC